MNLASICRYLLRFPLLCRKWVWLSWSLSSLEWSQRPVLPWCLTFSVDAASDQAYVAFKHVASNMFVFQQDNAASHRARTPLNSYSKKRRTSLVLISGRAQNSPAELNLVDYSFLGAVRHRVHECRMNSVDELKLRLIDISVCSRTLLTRPSTSAESNWKHACMKMDNILNTCCERVWLAKIMDK